MGGVTPMPGGGAAGYAERLLAVLTAFAEGPDTVPLTLLAERLDLPASSAHRLLEPLVAAGLVDRAPGRRYRIGTEFFRLGAVVANRFEIAAAARPLMAEAVAETGETCLLGLLTHGRTCFLLAEKVDCAQPLRFRFNLHRNSSLLWGSLGRAILAHLDPPDVAAVLAAAAPAPVSGAAPPDLTTLRRELAEIRRAGIAVSQGHVSSPETVGVAAPILGADGRVRGSLGIVAPDFRFGAAARERAVTLMRRQARRLSHTLGHAAPKARTA